MNYEEAIKILRKEQWKASPDSPLPQWLIEKDNPKAVTEFLAKSAVKYEALKIAIECVKAVNSLSKTGFEKPPTD